MRKFTFIFLMLILGFAYAENYVVVNSYDGRDVLSAIYYANAKGLPVNFMPSPNGNAELLAMKVGSGHDILVVQSSEIPVSGYLEAALKNKGNTLEVLSSADGGRTNIDLALRSGAKKFIIVDSAYSDSALSVLPYAAQTGAYVLLANAGNAGDVGEVVAGADSIIIYGRVDQEVRDALAKYNPETIGDGEDRYADNMLIVSRMMEEFGTTRVIFDEGKQLEEGMTEGATPILLSGRIVPNAVYDFVKENVRAGELTGMLVVDQYLVTPAYDMKTRITNELSAEGSDATLGVTIKFGQALPGTETVISLDTFPLPAYVPSMAISDIAYNTEKKSVMVTVDNTGEGSAYFLNELRVHVDGVEHYAAADTEARLVESGEKLGTEYALDLSGVPEGNVSATVITRYGYSKTLLDSFTTASGPLTEITYVDVSDVVVQQARYDSENGRVLITVRNNGADKAFFKNELELVLDGQPAKLRGSTNAIDANSLMVDEFPLELSEQNLNANRNVTIVLNYGSRDGFLANTRDYTVALQKDEGLPIWLILGVLLVLIAVIAALALFRKMDGKGG